MSKRSLFILAFLLFFAGLAGLGAQQAAATQQGASSQEPALASGAAVQQAAPASSPWKYLAAALAVGISCIAGGIAVGQIGAAAMGAMAENPELAGKALPYAGLAEGICLWGFLVGLLILLL